MRLYAWNPIVEKRILEDNSYLTISEQLTDFAYSPPSLPPNLEKFCFDVVTGNYDNIFDFSKDVIDIGACHGVYAIELAKKFNHSFAFEPNKTYAYLIGANVVLNNVVDKVTVFNEFLSNKNDFTDFNGWMSNEDDVQNGKFGGYLDTAILSQSACETQYNNYNVRNKIYHTISTKTLDSYKFYNVGFIKIDTEGCELRILQGAVETIKNNNYPPILFEMWPEDSSWIINKDAYRKYCSELISFLTNLGYDITYNVNVDPGTHLAVHKQSN